ncbi:hypothetical protein ACL02S_23945, partial [Nocardia sp. 004]|uniref:hypothetical protein n=1 Tax=Nocardia sp. 004 TaxID=3385978 RepID=UPI0039A01326
MYPTHDYDTADDPTTPAFYAQRGVPDPVEQHLRANYASMHALREKSKQHIDPGEAASLNEEAREISDRWRRSRVPYPTMWLNLDIAVNTRTHNSAPTTCPHPPHNTPADRNQLQANHLTGHSTWQISDTTRAHLG